MKTRTRKLSQILIAFLTIFVSQAAFGFYNPEIGRWANRDPIGEQGALNLYSYVHNNPVDYVDPLGLQLTGSGTLALEPTLLMSEEAIAALNAARAAKAAADAAKAAKAAADAAKAAAAAAAALQCQTRQHGKGERNWQHSAPSWKGWRTHPKDKTKIIGKDQNGKDIIKVKPPDFPAGQ